MASLLFGFGTGGAAAQAGLTYGFVQAIEGIGGAINSQLRSSGFKPDEENFIPSNLRYLSGHSNDRMELMSAGAGPMYYGNSPQIAPSGRDDFGKTSTRGAHRWDGSKKARTTGSFKPAAGDNSGPLPPKLLAGRSGVGVPSHNLSLNLKRKNMARKRATKSTKKTTYKSKRYGKMVLTRGPTYAPEIKHFDVKQVTQAIDGLNKIWSVLALPCVPTQGTDFLNRIGRRIFVKSVEVMVRFTVPTPADVPASGDMLIHDFFLDKESKGAAPAASDIYDNILIPGPLAMSPLNAAQLRRFHRYSRMSHDVNVVQNGVSVNISEMSMMKFKVNKVVSFKDTTATLADVLDNSFVLCVCNTVTATAAAYKYDVVCRYWFTDY